ncbi:DNRLRE domain-containing protein [Streptomyces fenghuangensis]
MRKRYRRLLSGLVVSAVMGTLLPQVAYAAPASKDGDDGGRGVVDTVADWFSGDEDDGEAAPPADGRAALPSREKLPRGKKTPAAKRVKELTGRRTAHARFWQLSDGRVEAELSAVPTSYRSGSGKKAQWKPIDTAVRPSDAKGFEFAGTANTGRSWFGSDPERLMRFANDTGQGVTIGLRDATGAKLKPEAEGDTVTYPGALPGADLSYQVGPGRVKENITLAERPDGPVSFTFTLDVDKLTPKAREDGSIAFYGEHPGVPVMEIPAAYMTDARKDASSPYGYVHSNDVTQKLTRHGDDWRLTVTPDADWLAAKERRYPVVIDPTVSIAPTPAQSQDVMVLSDQPSVNFNANWKLAAGRTDTGTARSLIKFPLDEIPAGVEVDSARLEMYFDQTHTTGGTDVPVRVHRATGAWDESTATWDSTSSLVGELSGTSVQVDDGDPATAASGSWPASGSTLTQYAVGGDYHYNKDGAAGDTYAWQPKVEDTATYRVDVHYVAATDRATNAPYTVTHRDGSATYTVDQSAGTGGQWTSLGGGRQLPFTKGTTGKVVLGDGPASTSTAVIADAVRLVNPAEIWKNVGEYNQWHKFPVTDTVRKWVSGTAANHGFVIKTRDESSSGPLGGPRYEAADGDYGGETSTYPRLTVTWGRTGTALDSPTVVHGTGPELHWKAYENTSGDSGLDIVEYQLHRSTRQAFTPSAATLVAPVDKAVTSFTDTTASPTPADHADEIGRSYYYQIAVKTKSGELLGSPTRVVGIPKAGRTMRLIQAGQSDTTLSSAQPDTNQDTIESWGVGQKWLSVGNNSGTYGTTRSVLKFPTSDIPTSATVLESRMFLWASQTTTGSDGAVYELRPLTRTFDETTATWNKASSSTAWSRPGGDYGSAVSDTTAQWGNEVGRHWWDATSMTQGWVSDPAANKGAMLKLADESSSGPQERSLFLSAEAADPQLRPLIRVIYVDSTAEKTYHAPQTPSRMIPGDTDTVEVTVTNTTGAEWTATGHELSYRWALPDGTDATTGGNQIATALPRDLAPGESVTVRAQVKAPINSDSGNKRLDHVLTWDVRNKTTGAWESDAGGVPGLAQNVAVEDPTSNQLGLEKFYSYAGKNTGAGSTVMNNLYAGNNVWSYNAFSNPGRGLSTFARFSYNSLDTSDTVLGHGWSAQLAAPIRSGAALDFHPNPNPTTVTLPDGDGTAHTFRKQTDGTWKAPAGVHYLLQQKAGVDCRPSADGDPRAWSMTRPDRTQFFFDCDGYLSAITDRNGNTQTYTYEERRSNNKPVKFLKYITDPAGRQTLTVDYYDKGQDYPYIDDAGVKQSGTKLTSPKIIDHIASMTDVSGRKLTFVYSDKGLLGELTDGAGSAQPKVFRFTYDATQGNKNVKLVKVTDPRGNATSLDYYDPSEGDDPKFHWAAQTVTDRLGHDTGFVYTDPDGTAGSTIRTRVTDAEGNASTYLQDGYGRPTQVTNAKSQTTKLSWDADNNVTRLEENNGAVTTYAYDPKTGYPLEQRDAEANKNGTEPQTLTYATAMDGHVADLWRKVSPEGRTWRFDYDTFGNLTSVTDPKGTATTTADDYTTTYTYDTRGQLKTATDANGNTTTHGEFGPTGYPALITDALDNTTSFVYDERGQVLESTDALGKTTTQTYDVFGRPLVSTVPKDQDAGELITTPAPVYDANDNITESTAPNGAVSTAVYDSADQLTSATEPKDTDTSNERRTTYAYDKVGNLLTTTEPKGNLTTTAGDYTTTHAYDAIYQLTSVVNAAGDKISYSYDDVGNLLKVTDPKKNASADTGDFTTVYAYDLNHRVTTVTDAAGHTTSRAYDKDSLVVSTTDAENNTTTVTYDERGMTTEAKVPHTKDASGTITYRTTRYEYDEVGNRTKVITPRAVAAGTTEAFTARTEYDALNRPVKRFQPYDPADSRYNDPNVYTETVYDAAGRVARTSLPPSQGQSVRNDTTYTYYDHGLVKSSTDPWDIVTTYDYNDLGLQTARTLTSAGGSSSRTMGWGYYPDGKLKSRTDDGVPVGKHVVLVDNSDTHNTDSTGTWTTADADGQQGYDHAVHAAGTGTDAFTWTLNIPADGTYTAYVKYPDVPETATTATYTLTHDGGTADKTIDQTADAGTWVSLGSYSFKRGNDAKLELFENDGGTVVADAVKLVRDTSGETDTEKKTFTYTYDANGNLTALDDTSSSARIDNYAIAYTGLNQVRKVTESLNGTARKSTSYTYDANGLPEAITHPDQHSTYTYDLRDLVKTVSIGKSATDADPKVTSYTYTDRGQRLKETKANGNTVDYAYYLDGPVKSTTEKKAGGTLVSSHTYAYDPNGNKARDVAKKMNADDHTAYLESTTDYTYDPADRLAKSVKTGNGAGTETYVHDDNANVVSQTLKGTTTTYDYDRNRLLSATAVGGTTSTYNYDPFGRQESVTSGGKVISRSVYDGFDHVVESLSADSSGGMKSTTYTFDPLDRTASKTADGKTTTFNYLGLSGEVLTEEVSGALTKSYQYSPWGERLSQVKHDSDGTTEAGYYGYNAHTDVETLTDKNGDTKATYGYTAYGSDETSEFTGIDKPDATDPTKEAYNPYRYNAKRWDAQSGTYDMGFRDYSPGLNRFTTRDMYNGALADMKLGADPFTGNRYAFTGGNPVTNVEIDGHFFALPAIAYWVAGAMGLSLYAATPQGQQNLRDAGEALGNLMPSAQEAGSGSSESSNEPRPSPTPQPTPGPAPRPAPRGTDTDSASCNPLPLIDGGRIYGGLEEYTNHQGKKGCRATAAFAFLTKSDRRSRTGAGGLPRCPECEPSVKPDGMGEIAAGGGKPQAGHLIGYWGKGTGQDVRNLVALHGKANRRMASKVERFGWKHLTGNNKLIMSVVPVYGDPHSAVPTSVQVGMTAYGPQGNIVDSFSCTAVNSPTGIGSKC